MLLDKEYSAKYLFSLWKKVRKLGGLCTGITQNVLDMLQNYTAPPCLPTLNLWHYCGRLSRASWSSFLKFSAIHYQMGFENASLLYAQRPDARMVETYAGWREIWRLDKSNEKEMLALLHAKSVNVQDYVKEAVEREVYHEDKKYIENISELCRYNSQNPEHIYDITNAVIQSAQYMAAVRMGVKPPPVSSLLPVLATAPRLMVYGLCNAALSVAGQVLTGIEKVFEMKREKQRGASEREGSRKEQEIGENIKSRNGRAEVMTYQPSGVSLTRTPGPHKRQGNGSHKGVETARYEQLSLSFDGGYARCDCGRAL